MIDVAVLPEPLRAMPRFLLWRLEPGPKKPLKVPFYASGTRRNGVLDESADLAQLATFDEAVRVLKLGGYDGLGFAVTNEGIGAFDLDGCLDEDGKLIGTHPGYELAEEARRIGAYCEISPSGRGLRIVGPCQISDYYSKEGVEYFGEKKFVTLTGNVWANSRSWIALDGLRASLGTPRTAVEREDDEDRPIITPKIIDELPDALSFIPADDRTTWVNMGLALKAELPEAKARSLWDEWSRSSDKYDAADADRVWKSMRPTSTGYKAVFAEAKRHGWKNPAGRDVATRVIDGEVLDRAEVSEDAIASAFTAQYRDELRFDFNVGRWFRWNRMRWERDETALALHFARQLGRSLTDGQRSMCKFSVAAGAERFARADPAHATTSAQWDTDPMLLGTPGGTVDLKTGELRAPDPKHLITKLTTVAPEAGEPTLWLKFLDEALGGDRGTIEFIRQWFGYCLTGDTREHSLVFLYGPGGNGKSVCINTLVAILGDYAGTSTMETFTASRFDRHSTDLAMLRGARLVTASETEDGRAWAESRIKQLTGGDPITARFMRQDNFTFRPEFKLMIAGNHAPSLRNVDDAMKRRLIIVPFTARPKTPDPLLETKLRAEHGKILNWAIEGCLHWQWLGGLQQPSAITAATDDYFDNQDLFGQWLDERCDLGERCTATPSALFRSWNGYAHLAGEEAGTMKSFVSELQRRGFTPGKSNGARMYRGLKLRFGEDDEPFTAR